MDFEPQNVEFKRARKCECCKSENRKITALKISNPSRVFAAVAKAGFMGATDRSTKSQRLWTSSLRMWKFNRLESWNFRKFATRIFDVALAKGKPQETGKTASFVPPAFPPPTSASKNRAEGQDALPRVNGQRSVLLIAQKEPAAGERAGSCAFECTKGWTCRGHTARVLCFWSTKNSTNSTNQSVRQQKSTKDVAAKAQ